MENEADLEIDYKGIGRRIKATRKKKGLSQKSLAMLANIAVLCDTVCKMDKVSTLNTNSLPITNARREISQYILVFRTQ